MPDLLSPNSVSDFLLSVARERGELLTNLKLQKLLYYAQAWKLALDGTELFAEDFQAWVHGPVLPSQYRRFRDYRWRPIMDEIARPQIDATTAIHLEEVLDVFGPETAVALEIMTHREAPWLEARRGLAPDIPSENVISKNSMEVFYRGM